MFAWLLRLFRKPSTAQGPPAQGPPPKGGSAGKPRPRTCKNCGRPLRGLYGAPGIPVHVDTESRFCDAPAMGLPPPATEDKPTRFATWPGEDMTRINEMLREIKDQGKGEGEGAKS